MGEEKGEKEEGWGGSGGPFGQWPTRPCSLNPPLPI